MAAGFRSDDISVLAPDQDSTKELATEKNTKAPEGATTGAATGGVSAEHGLLAGSRLQSRRGPLIAAGPIAGRSRVGAGAQPVDIGALVGMGIPEYEAKRYEGRVKNGGILVSVHCDNSDWTDRAEKIFKNSGADDISSTGEKKGQTRTGGASNVPIYVGRWYLRLTRFFGAVTESESFRYPP